MLCLMWGVVMAIGFSMQLLCTLLVAEDLILMVTAKDKLERNPFRSYGSRRIGLILLSMHA